MNVITALTSNQMIAPSFWVDPNTGNDYMLTVQYPENRIRNLLDLRSIPLHAEHVKNSTLLDAVTKVTRITSPTEIDHYQIRRVIDIYVNPAGEDLGTLADGIRRRLEERQCLDIKPTFAAWCEATSFEACPRRSSRSSCSTVRWRSSARSSTRR
jgi:Cu/Ag efflux pump CusA